MEKARKIALALHGGAGDLPFWGMDKTREQTFIKALEHCLDAGYKVLKEGGTALDAVEETVSLLEDEPIFNAGTGSALNTHGDVEMDASIMCGNRHTAGLVSTLIGVKNPIRVARKLMEECECIYLSGAGANEFAKENNVEFREKEYFITQERYEHWQDAKKKDTPLEHGTAGAVALDIQGDLAAGTSTGGLVNKRRGRVGDSAIIGAGTYASNETCAVSCSGTGEYIIRNVTAHEISSMLKYKGWNLSDACDYMLKEKLNPLHGQFGIIALDRFGNIKSVFNTKRMYRAWMTSDGERQVLLY